MKLNESRSYTRKCAKICGDFRQKMKIINYDLFVKKICELCIKTNYSVDEQLTKQIKKELESSKKLSKLSKIALELFLENAKIAEEQELPVCQDTGIAVFFVELGNNVKLSKKTINAALQEAASQAYIKGNLRKSIIQNPLTRKPISIDNSPAVIHYDIVAGSNIRVWFMPKGGGSENVSTIKFFNPSNSEKDIINFVIEHLKNVGAKACPPYKLGICLGGTFEYCALMSKKVLIDEFADTNRQALQLSRKIKKAINDLRIGPQGFGEFPSVMKVNIKLLPAHIAMLPVAISISCNAVRIGKIEF